MATYSNPHWLLCHIRNSFISTDDTGMCEMVMISDDMPKHYLKRYKSGGCCNKNYSGGNYNNSLSIQEAHRSSIGDHNLHPKNWDAPLQDIDFICYPNLDQSDDEDTDLSTQSFDIQMYPEVGAHRFRSNTAQKLEKMDIARRKAARTKCVIYDDDLIPPNRSNFFERKPISVKQSQQIEDTTVKSKLALQLASSPKQIPNKFQEYAKFDGTSQTGVQIKRINVFLNMLPEGERNYPIKICVLANAKIQEVIGFVCYKAIIQFPNLSLKSVHHYGLYMSEDNDDFDDFPPLDNREPCSKFGFSNLTLAERRPQLSTSRLECDLQPKLTAKSLNSDEEKMRLPVMPAIAVANYENIASESLIAIDKYDKDDVDSAQTFNLKAVHHKDEMERRIMCQDDVLDAPIYRTYSVYIIDKRFFRTEVTLGISEERIEIDQHKQGKFWTKQRADTYPIHAVAFCEIIERRSNKAILRIWLRASSSQASTAFLNHNKYSVMTLPTNGSSSCQKQQNDKFTTSNEASTPSMSLSGHHQQQQHHQTHQHHHHIRFKHYDFETSLSIAEQINNKLNFILEMRTSDIRREFLQLRGRKREKIYAKKSLKL